MGQHSRAALKALSLLLAIPSLSSLVTSNPAWALGCDEPFVRPSYVSRSTICSVGEYVVDSYAPGSQILCEEMELDHLVSLRQAWESGVCGDDLKRFANDRLNLRPTYWRTNRLKGRMSPFSFSQQLSEDVADTVRRDAVIVMQKYGILSHRELIEQKFAALMLRMPTIPVPLPRLSENAGRFTLKRVGSKTLILAGKRVVGTITVVGGTYTAAEISLWSYRHLFIPDRNLASKDRAAKFEEIIGAFE